MRRVEIDYSNTNNIINNLRSIVRNLESEQRKIKSALSELYDLENYYYNTRSKKLNKYLPIGTIVLLNNGNKKIMIYGRKQIHAQSGIMFDYVACFYPEGNIDEKYTFLFNNEDIREVVFRGYEDEDEVEFNDKLKKIDRELKRVKDKEE